MNAPRAIDNEDLANRFAYHQPSSQTVIDKHEEIRDRCRVLAELIVFAVPPGREASLAITALEEAMMWANAGIARNQVVDQ